MSINPQSIGWVAGLLEGEGSFNYLYHRGANPRIIIQMTDYDILAKLKRAINCNSIVIESNRHKPRINSHWKKCYSLNIYGRLAIGLMMTIYPLMGNRRQKSIRDIIYLWKTESKLTLYSYQSGTQI